MNDAMIVLVTASDADEARRIGRELLERRLAACVNILPIGSMYWWEGVIEEASEALMIIKTRAARMEALIDAVRRAHSYDTPEIIGLPAAAGSPEYLQWIADETER